MVYSEGGLIDAGPGQHVALFYRDETELAERVGGYLGQAVTDGGAAVVIATSSHRRLLEERLAVRGTDVAAARAAGSYLDLDAGEMLNGFMLNGWPNPGSFWLNVSPLIRPGVEAGRRVRFFGEMVALLWDAGRVEAAIELEALWNEMGSHYQFSMLCAYSAQSVGDDQHHDAVAEVCRLHTETIVNATG